MGIDPAVDLQRERRFDGKAGKGVVAVELPARRRRDLNAEPGGDQEIAGEQPAVVVGVPQLVGAN